MQEYLHQRADEGESLSDSRRRRLYQTADAGGFLPDSGCRSYLHQTENQEYLSIRQRMQGYFYQTANAGVSDSGSRSQTADAEDILSVSGCRSLSIRQRMQETPPDSQGYLYQTADAGVSSSDCGCRSISIRQRMQEYLHQTADSRSIPLSDSVCSNISIRQRMQKTFYQ